MAEERNNDRNVSRDTDDQRESKPIVFPPNKKKRGKVGILFLSLLLAVGAATGLHFSGMWDGRPLLWEYAPKIPYIGKNLSSFLRVPEQYTLTAADRRAFELTEWQKRLDERERGLSNRESEVNTASDDLGARASRVARQEERARQNPAQNQNAADANSDERKLMENVAKTYQDMSARNAAQIIEQLSEPLAVELMQKLPVDARGSILGKMDPRKAARLTELMAGRP
ncbi:hypothetical protein FACS1894204_02250 [Synergistales bacterium]|nr:hypothetical protein FACS1894204_02250 [Synergistales bacterium]